jgi:hypothetical protein
MVDGQRPNKFDKRSGSDGCKERLSGLTATTANRARRSRRERQIVSFGQPFHQPLRQFRTVQERDKTAGGSQAHFCAPTKLLSRLTATAITTTPMNHLIKRSGSRAGTRAEVWSGTPQSLEQTDTQTRTFRPAREQSDGRLRRTASTFEPNAPESLPARHWR